MASIWVDYLERDFLDTEFKELVNSGLVNGITSNPAIFANAITKSDAYKEDIAKLKGSPKEIYEELAIKDIQKACDVLEDKYNEGDDGFASIEVSPTLANDAKGTIDEALRLVDRIQRDNLMIKIPATKAGYEAMQTLAKKGININATLVFSPTQANRCAEALSYLPRDKEGVISVFVSRFDRELNPKLASANLSKDRVGFFNAIKIYNQVSQTKLPNVNLKVCFSDLAVYQNWLDKGYYVEQLNLHNAILNLPIDVIDYYEDEKMPEAFEFQTKHIDAFLSYLSYANISLQSTYEILLNNALKEPF